ncbi:MAG: hypothetical protein WC208_09250 [Gallionella sp.]|jgi:hypothetical protein
MNAYGIVLKPAKAALILFGLSVLIAFAAVAGLAQYRTGKEQAIKQKDQQLAATHEDIRKLTFDLDSINKLASKYRQLTFVGFIGEPDRDGWVQRLESIYRDTHLPATLRYTLAPPLLLHPQPVAAGTPTAYQNNVLHHDLNIDLSAIHEGELLDFMEQLATDWRAPYRLETCQMSRAEVNEPITGLQIKCTVQLYSLPVLAKAP